MKQILLATCFALFSLMSAAHAELSPAFHNVPLQTLKDSLKTFPTRGIGPRSLSVYQTGNQAFTAGVFDAQSTVNVAKVAMAMDTFSQVKASLDQKGYAPVELSIFASNSGVSIYSGIWGRPAFPTVTEYFMTDAQFTQKWQEWAVQKGFRIADYVVYSEANLRRHAAIFVKDNRPYFFFYGLDAATFAAKAKEMAAAGFWPDNMNIGQTPTGEVYSAIFMKPAGGLKFYYNMSSAEYQKTFNTLGASGFRLKKVFGYGNGNRFAAIWIK